MIIKQLLHQYIKLHYCLVLFFLSHSFFSQNQKVISGPMQGHVTPTSTHIWVLLSHTKLVEAIVIDKNTKQAIEKIVVSTDTITHHQNYFPLQFSFSHLKPSTEYEFTLTVNHQKLNDVFKFKTPTDSTIANFSFLAGSCALLLPKWTTPVLKSGTTKMFKSMPKVKADFMLWLGDYLYYLRKDFASPERMWEKQIDTRKRKNLNSFLKQYPQYAIWDDHDFGPYNGESNYKLKDTTLFLHKIFWANPSYGNTETKGIFTSFTKHDAEFILLDDRYYRTQPNIKEPTMLGKEQLGWLFQKLKSSNATFKFIVIGSQVLNTYKYTGDDFGEMAEESYELFPKERQEILDFIKNNSIKGVIFMSGDRHFTVLERLERPNAYPLYDFTCSPLTSFVEKPRKDEEKSSLIVKGTLLRKRNFSRINILGEKNNRRCVIEVFDDKAKLHWQYSISENELK